MRMPFHSDNEPAVTLLNQETLNPLQSSSGD